MTLIDPHSILLTFILAIDNPVVISNNYVIMEDILYLILNYLPYLHIFQIFDT
jgi:hypothetical protein